MRAAVLEKIGSPLVVKDIPDPKPGAGDAVLKVLAVPVLSIARQLAGSLPFPEVPYVPGSIPCV